MALNKYRSLPQPRGAGQTQPHSAIPFKLNWTRITYELFFHRRFLVLWLAFGLLAGLSSKAVAQTQPVVLPKVPYIEGVLTNRRVEIFFDTQGSFIPRGTRVEFQRRVSAGEFRTFSLINPPGSSETSSGLLEGDGPNYFQVRLYNGDVVGPPSDVVQISADPSVAPSMVRDLRASYNAASGAVTLNWKPPLVAGDLHSGSFIVSRRDLSISISRSTFLGTLDSQVFTYTDTDRLFPGFEYLYQVRAENSVGSSKADVLITIPNRTNPKARAGEDQTVGEDVSVMLNGSGSTDADIGDVLNYRWAQVNGPTVQLTDNGTATPTFTTPILRGSSVEELRFRLTVTDLGGNSSSDEVTIVVRKSLSRDSVATAHVSITNESRFGREGGQFNFIATIGRPFPEELRFNWETLDGSTADPALLQFLGRSVAGSFSAVDGVDYRGASGILVFPPFQTQASFRVATIDDDISEGSEFFTLKLSEVATDPLPDRVTFNRFTRVILLDDEPITVLVGIAEVEAAEGDDITFSVDFDPHLLTGRVPEVRFEWSTADGTAMANNNTVLAGRDYLPTNGVDRFPFGAIGYLITVPGREDDIVERDETFTLTFTAIDDLPATVSFAGDPMNLNMTQAIGRILDDDSAVIQIADASAQEGMDLVFPITMSQQVVEAVRVDWSIEPSNAQVREGEDYQGSSGSIMIPAGETTATITVPSLEDTLFETGESFVVTLSLPDDFNGALSIGSTATGTIEDNDGTRAAIADATVMEGGALSFAVSMSQAAIEDVVFNVATGGGTATAGSDYRAVTNAVLTIPTGARGATVTVMTAEDTLIEGNEDFTVTLSAAGALPGRVFLGDDTATGTIEDNDVAVVSVTDAMAVEGSALSFAVSLERAAVADVALNWSTVDGTAMLADADYRGVANSVLTIPAGETDAMITVMSREDALVEEDESFTVKLLSIGDGPTVTFNNATATGIIENNDTATMTIDDATATEGDDLVFAVRLTQAAAADIKLTWSTSGGTATSGDDYRPATDATLTIPAGDMEAAIIVTSHEDTLVEEDENFTVTLSVNANLPSGVTLIDSTATGTIEENDTTHVTIDDAMALEGEDFVFAVRLTQAAVADIGLTWSTSDGTATAGDDYRVVTNRVLTIPAGATEAAIIVTSLTDRRIEEEEDFTVTLSAPAHLLAGVILTDPTATGTITPMNHLPTAQFIWPTTVREGETVALDGSGSSDPDGDDQNLTYIWSYLDAEERDRGARVDLDVTFDLTDPVRPTFVAPNVSAATDLIVSLVVRDERGGESPPFTLFPKFAILVLPTEDPTAKITVSTPHFVIPGTQPPQVFTPSTAVFLEGETVTLDSSGSSDPLVQGLRYQWRVQRGSTPFTLTDSQSAMATFVTPALPDTGNPRGYSVRLVVKDASDRESQSVSANIRVVSQPMAEAGGPQTVVEGTTVTLNDAGSIGHIDPNTSAPLIYAWTQTGGTPTVDLENADTARATFTAPDGLAPGMVLELAFELTITTEFNVSASDTAAITVVDTVAVTAPDDQTYTIDTAITDLTLPEATGGVGTLTYTLTPLPDGLNFNATTRVLSGAPSTADTTTLTYRVMDANGANTNATFTVTVNASLTLDTPANQNYTQGTAITVQLPEATGGTTPLQYTLTGQFGILPTGLTFTPNTRTLSGTPGTANTTTLTYRVTDANGANTNATFTVTVNSNLALDTPDDQNYTQGTAITVQLPEATGGTAPMRYTLTGPSGTLPAGLEFDVGTRTLSGTPDMAGTTTLTYRVIDAIGTARQTQFTVTVNASLTLDTPANQNYTQNTLITELPLPAATGGTGTLTYTLTSVPGGLTFTPGTRTLSGTPGTTAITELTYTAADDNGSTATATFTITVANGLALNAPGNQTYTMDTAITNLALPMATGGTTPLTYTLTPLPDGLNFNATTRVLSGAPTTEETVTTTYTATDKNGASQSAAFTITVRRDMLPTFAVTEFDLPENSDPPQVMLSATDGDGEAVTLTLGNELDGALFSLEPIASTGGTTTANLHFIAAPDFEMPQDVATTTPLDPAGDNVYLVNIRASSENLAGATVEITQTIEVTVTNIDDNDPVLAPKTSPLTSIEGEMAPLQTFTLTDADVGEAQAFALSGADQGLFALNPTTGVFRLAATTTAGSYSLTVTGTSGSREDAFTLTVNIIADAAPAFVDTSFSLAENTNNPITLTATEANNDDVLFTLQSGMDAGRFTLADGGAGDNTATLTFNAVPDFEAPLDEGGNNVYELSVQASSMTGTRAARTTTETIRITVTPVDDNEPVLDPTQAIYEAPENSIETIVTLQATDADGDIPSFEILNNPALSPDHDDFILDPSSGDLRFASAQDFEAHQDTRGGRLFAIRVEVTSGSVNRDRAPRLLLIRLTAVDEDDPIITPTQATYHFLTGATGTIATFTIEDSDAGEVRAFSALEAVPGSGTNLAAFNFNTSSGVLSFQGAAVNATSRLIIHATSNTEPAMRTITITVANDRPPVFADTAFALPEDSNPPQVMLSATDADGATVSLTLTNAQDSGLFTLEDSASVGGTTTANLRFKDQPDFEAPADTATPGAETAGNNIYLVRARARSMNVDGIVARTTETIRITVTGVDEHDPTLAITPGPYNLAENSTAVIATLTGADQDRGDTVSLIKTGADEALFDLNAATGALTFAAAPDFENPRGMPLSGDNTNNYHLSVQAESGIDPNERRSAALDLVITVTPVDEFAPVLAPKTSPLTSIEGETAPLQTFTLTDADDGEAQSFALSGADVSSFELGTTSGVLRLAATTTAGSYSLTISGTSGSRADAFALTVNVAADAAPIISTTSFSLAENTNNPITLTATEANNDDVLFALQSGMDAGRFTFADGGAGTNTATLTFNAVPDFEVPLDEGGNNVYELSVQASSTTGGRAARTTTETITITVTGVDEHLPVLAPKTSPLTSIEGETAPLQTFTLTDADDGEAQSFALSGTDVSSFELGTTSGVLRLDTATTAGSYSLTVTGTSGSRADAFTFTVNVMSDNPAVFADTEFDLPENSDPPQVMLSATDADDATVTLTLMNVRDGALFSLEDSLSTGGTTTANLRFKDQPDFENPADTATSGSDTAGNNIYLVRVRASSMNLSGVAVPTTETITITVTGVDEFAPVLAPKTSPLTSIEGETAPLQTFTLTDADDGEAQSFALSGADVSSFELGTTSGALTLATTTTAGSYSLTVTGTSGSRADSFTFTVDVAADAAPVFVETSFSLAENTNNPITLTATEANNDDVLFTLQSGMDAGRFTLADGGAADNTAALTFNAVPDFEVPLDEGGNNIYELSVQASSTTGGRAARTTTETITITVTGVDEFAPVLAPKTSPLTSIEGETAPLQTFTLTDADDGEAQSFALSGADVSSFELGTTSGALRLAATTAAGSYSLTVTGTSGSRADAFTFTVNIIADAAPIISTASFSLAENTNNPITLAATEANNDDVLFTLQSGMDAGRFTLADGGAADNTATLTFNAVPDFEVPLDEGGNNIYELSVQASSTTGGRAARTTTETITITVTGVDEFAPVLAPKTSPLTSIEGETAPLQTFTLTDADDGEAQSFALSGADVSSFELGTTSGALRLAATTAAGSYSLTVTGTSGSRADAFTFTVNIIADAAPIISTASFSLAENTNNPITLAATEANNDDVLFTLQSGMDAGRFTLADGGAADNTATLTFNAVPDFEVPLDEGGNNIYELSVQASSITGARAARTTTETIRIEVTPVDEFAPVLTPKTSPLTSIEGETAPLQTFTLTDADDGEAQSFALSGADVSSFELGTTSGALRLATTTAAGSYSLTVTGTSGSRADSFTFTVDVAADAAPVFVETSFSLAENTNNPITLTATEANNDDVVFTLQSGMDAGRFTFADGGAGADTATLTFNAAPDFEDPQDDGGNNIYQVSVQASSMTGTRAARTTTETITITVTPVDEHLPVLAPKTSPLTSIEGETAPLQTFTLTDADAGEAQSFALSGTDQGLFALNPTTGVLRLDTTTTAGSYSLTVTGTSGSRADSFPLIVNVAGDAAPIISTTSFSLAENTNNPITLTATEANNDDVVFTLQSGMDAGRFTFADGGAGANTATLTFQDVPDFEAPLDDGGNNIYQVSVQASSMTGTRAARTTTETITITVTPVDEFAPVLAPKTSPLTSVEGEMAPLQTFTLTDADDGEVQAFALSGTDISSFELNPTSGVFRLATTTTAGSYSLTITGTSGGRADAFTFTVDVAADAAPVFVETSFSLAENTNNPITLTATEANNDDVLFTLQSGMDTGRFTLADGGAADNTAALTFNAVPDFEDPQDDGGNNIYQLSVQASSTTGARAARTTTETITITVTGVDEDPPVLAPKTSPLTSIEGETAPLQTFTLTDADDGEAQSFALSGADVSSFELGTTSGVLRLDTATAAGSYSLTVTGTSGSRADAFTFTVNVAADAAPIISTTSFSLAENTNNPITLTATEANNDDVLFTLQSGMDTGRFTLADGGAADNTAALTFNAVPDFEDPQDEGGNNIYQVSVQASSTTGARAARTTTETIRIEVTPVDEFAPVLTPKTSPLTSIEGETAPLQTFTLTDADDGEAQSFALSGADVSSFELGTTSGVLRLAATTTAGSYSLTVSGTSGSRADAFTFTVNVAADAAPIISTTSFSLAENTNNPITLTATEANNDDVLFTLQSGMDTGRFTLADGGAGANTATLTFQDVPDFENPLDEGGNNIYQLSVQASSITGARAARTTTERSGLPSLPWMSSRPSWPPRPAR